MISSLKGRALLEIAGNRVDALLEEGRRFEASSDLQGAVRAYRQALTMEPNDSRVLHRLGLAAYRSGKLEQAKVLIQRSVELSPNRANYHQDLGNVLKHLGDLLAAEASLERAKSLDPESALIHYDLGIVYQIDGRLDKALTCYQICTMLDPVYPEAWNNLGLVYKALGDWNSAIGCFGTAIREKPEFAGAYINLGNVYKDVDDLEQAVDAYQNAMKADPKLAAGFSNLGNVYLLMKKLNGAVACYQQAAALQPNVTNHWVNLGASFQGLDEMQQAIHCYQKALSMDPRIPQALLNLGLVYKELGRHTEALDCIQKAVEIDPDYENALSNLVQLLIGLCEWESADFYGKKLDRFTTKALKAGRKPAENPFLNLIRHMDPALNYKVARAWSRELEKTVQACQKRTFGFINSYRDSKIRIGYLSGNFRNHPTADLTLGLFALHDRKRFDISCYAYGKDDGSKQRTRIAASSDHFHDIDAMDDRSAANLIQSHGVDILIDLMGFTKGARLGICAWRPAPIQVRMLGMAGTTGASFFDYLITDRIVTPQSDQAHYSENFVFMSDCYQINTYRQMVPMSSELKKFEDRDNKIIFACFCTAYKIEQDVFEAWMRILLRVPNSELWLMPESPRVKQNLQMAARIKGVDPARIRFQEKLEKNLHFKRLLRVDLALDTKSVNGAATTSDALWAGVPLLTFKGGHFASRMSESILESVGLSRMVAFDLTKYEQTAVDLALHPKALHAIRDELIARLSVCPLFDSAGYVKNLERAYRIMWQSFVSGEPAGVIDLKKEQIL